MSEETTPLVDEVDTGVYEFPEKEAQTDHYELMVLIPGQYTEEDASKIFEEVKELIGSFDGELTDSYNYGRRKLAYTIDGESNGNYFVAEYNLDRSQAAALSEKLRIRKDIARYLVLKKRVLTEEEEKENERIANIIAGRKKQNEDVVAELDAEEAQTEEKTNE